MPDKTTVARCTRCGWPLAARMEEGCVADSCSCRCGRFPHCECGRRTETTPKPGSKWRHYNGIPYTVLHIANEPNDDRYPLTVVYQGPNGKVWARRADDWHRSMTEDLPYE